MSTWVKLGNVFTPDQTGTFESSHAQLPITIKGWEAEEPLVLFTGRNALNQSLPFAGYLRKRDQEVKLELIKKEPLMALGKPGTFDDAGVMPTSAVMHEGKVLIFYIGWNKRDPIPYHNAVGIAELDLDTMQMKRRFEGPVLDRTHMEPYFVGTADVHLDEGKWKAWYLSCTEWKQGEGRLEPKYLIRYAESADGINWMRTGQVAIPYAHDDEAIAGASLIGTSEGFEMYYSYRSIHDYRNNQHGGYRIGKAVSADGMEWKRVDEEMMAFNMERTPWDNEMTAYPHVFEWGGETYMLFNGNGFGQSGIGIALKKND